MRAWAAGFLVVGICSLLALWVSYEDVEIASSGLCGDSVTPAAGPPASAVVASAPAVVAPIPARGASNATAVPLHPAMSFALDGSDQFHAGDMGSMSQSLQLQLSARPGDVFRVATFGGSITACHGTTTEECWPFLITQWWQDLLDSDVKVQLDNLAIGGSSSRMPVICWEQVLDEMHGIPDIVYIEYGLNDHLYSDCNSIEMLFLRVLELPGSPMIVLLVQGKNSCPGHVDLARRYGIAAVRADLGERRFPSGVGHPSYRQKHPDVHAHFYMAMMLANHHERALGQLMVTGWQDAHRKLPAQYPFALQAPYVEAHMSQKCWTTVGVGNPATFLLDDELNTFELQKFAITQSEDLYKMSFVGGLKDVFAFKVANVTTLSIGIYTGQGKDTSSCAKVAVRDMPPACDAQFKAHIGPTGDGGPNSLYVEYPVIPIDKPCLDPDRIYTVTVESERCSWGGGSSFQVAFAVGRMRPKQKPVAI